MSVIPYDNFGVLSNLLILFINLLSLPDHKIRDTQVHVVPAPLHVCLLATDFV